MFTHRKKPASARITAVLSACGLTLVLAACSPDGTPLPAAAGPATGSGPASAPLPPPPPPPPWLSSPAPDNGSGIWFGTLSRQGEVVNGASCLITEAGEIACVLYPPEPTIVLASDPIVGVYGVPPTAAGGAYGTLDLTDTFRLSGSGTLYAAPGAVLSDESSTVAAFVITGGSLTDIPGTPVNPVQKQLDLTISSLGEVSTLTARFDHYYFREAHGLAEGDTSSWIEGVYATFAIFDDPASLSIAADGSLFSQSAAGCVLSGHIGIIDWPYNGYAAELTMANCDDLTGTYTGLAFLSDFVWVNGTDNLLISAFNETGFIAGEARKYDRILP